MANPTNNNVIFSYAKVDFGCPSCGKLIKQDHFIKTTEGEALKLTATCNECGKNTNVTITNGIGTIS